MVRHLNGYFIEFFWTNSRDKDSDVKDGVFIMRYKTWKLSVTSFHTCSCPNPETNKELIESVKKMKS